MKKLALLSAFGLSAIVTGCATTTQQPQIDCAAPDWHAVGIEDGKAGRYPYEISRHQKQCQAIKLTPEIIKTWEAGRQIGLNSYCSKGNAYEIGQRGYSLNQVCPEAGLLEIQQSHALGYQQYYRRAQLSRDWAYPMFHPWYAPLPYRYWR